MPEVFLDTINNFQQNMYSDAYPKAILNVFLDTINIFQQIMVLIIIAKNYTFRFAYENNYLTFILRLC